MHRPSRARLSPFLVGLSGISGAAPAALCLLAALLAGVGAPARAAEPLVFTTAPTQPPEQTRKMYQPLVDHLSAVTGVEIRLQPARTFLEYTLNMRKGVYDMYFDGPQFVGWRMDHQGHQLLAKLPGAIRFVVVVRTETGIREVAQLAGKPVCGFASPNLLTLGFLDLFPSAASQPAMVKSGTFKGALECVRSGRGVAAVMRDKFWEKRKPAEREGLRLIHTSEPYPHRAFSVAGTVGPALVASLRAALLADGAREAGAPILKRFRSPSFVPAAAEEYRGMGRLLSSVWGFD